MAVLKLQLLPDKILWRSDGFTVMETSNQTHSKRWSLLHLPISASSGSEGRCNRRPGCRSSFKQLCSGAKRPCWDSWHLNLPFLIVASPSMVAWSFEAAYTGTDRRCRSTPAFALSAHPADNEFRSAYDGLAYMKVGLRIGSQDQHNQLRYRWCRYHHFLRQITVKQLFSNSSAGMK